ncbi:MAG: 5'/3'-nucleotidase SurE [Desulfatitalea sp.]|nr:5'/3'-nucleotidase SurE [Desulfatitalea sp.]NNK01319.1 5'/3'-nucleotidase SurE [Desulfatitalea sp.]
MTARDQKTDPIRKTSPFPLDIVLTNDDGIESPGLWALYDALAPDHRVMVAAPERERSAVGHGITLHKPLRAYRTQVNGGYEGWAVSGTPADCVKLCLLELFDGTPDLVISGINPGANVGINVHYSGTVGAAKEAALYGVPAIAASVRDAQSGHYAEAAAFVAHLACQVKAHGLPAGVFLNVNCPNAHMQTPIGVKIVRQGCETHDEFFDKRRDPRDRIYYWQGLETQPTYRQADSDGALLTAGYITITPVQCDMTDYAMIEQMQCWEIG